MTYEQAQAQLVAMARRNGRPCRRQEWDRAVREAGRAGDDRRALRLRAHRLLDRRQLQLARRQRLDRADGGDWKNARLIHLPVHASWLNQIELYFSIVQRKALTPNDFDSLEALTERLLQFADHYRQIARPFEWTFSRADLERLLARIDAHEPQLTLAA
jgi:hypothetical protein